MISLFTRCVACGQEPDLESFPLCRICDEALRPCPEPCPRCWSLTCGRSCRRPWARPGSEPGAEALAVQSLTVRYLLIEPGYRVLRRWKVSSGVLLENRILKWEGLKIPEVDAIVPLPQDYGRSWKLSGSPALRIAASLSAWLKVPMHSALTPLPGTGLRQAELKARDRLRNRLRFEASKTHALSVLLVDDFVTSGHTLKCAARSLLDANPGLRIHGFCLGLRPRRLSELEQNAHLVESA